MELINNNNTNNKKIIINITKKYINKYEDFIEYLKKNYENEFYKNNNNIIEKISIIKNYLTTNEFEKILLNYPINKNFNNILKINLTANNLNLIPKNISQLINLNHLILNNNKITEINFLSELKNLEILELKGNQLISINGIFTKENNNKIKKLTVSCNLIKSINENMLNKNIFLEELGLFGNFLGDEKNIENNKAILIELCEILNKNFCNLKHIYIGGNHFSSIENLNDIIKNKIPKLITIDGKNL